MYKIAFMAYGEHVVDQSIVPFIKNPMNLPSGLGYTHETNVALIIKKYMDKLNDKEYELIQVENSYQGFMWCLENNINILNVSATIIDGVDLDYNYQKALDKNMKIIVSAGNSFERGETILSRKDNYVTSVAALDMYGQHFDFSSWGGGHVDIACLGIHEIGGKNRYGTSYAAPVATAITAIYDIMFYEKYGRCITMKESYDFYKERCFDIEKEGKDLKTGFGWLRGESLKGGVIEMYPPDIKGHWAEETLKKYIDMGVIEGYPDGTIKPDRQPTLAEILTIFDRMQQMNS